MLLLPSKKLNDGWEEEREKKRERKKRERRREKVWRSEQGGDGALERE